MEESSPFDHHRDYATWRRSWVKILVGASLIDLLCEFLVIRQLSGQDFWLLFSAAMVLVVFASTLIFVPRYKLRVFRREWREQHQPEK